MINSFHLQHFLTTHIIVGLLACTAGLLLGYNKGLNTGREQTAAKAMEIIVSLESQRDRCMLGLSGLMCYKFGEACEEYRQLRREQEEVIR